MSQKQFVWFLIAVTLMTFLLNVDYTVVNLSLVTIAHALNSTLDVVKWLLSAFMLAWAVVIVPFSHFLERYGARRTFISGLILFMLGSCLTGFAMNMTFCIVGRILQGIAGALYTPAAYALVQHYTPKEKLGSAMGIVSLGVGFGMAAGPTLGGLILSYLGWRWIFFINIPLCILSVILILLTTTKDNFVNKVKFDSVSSLLLGLALAGSMLVLGEFQNQSATWLCSIAIISLVFFGLFYQRQQSLNKPLVPFSIFHKPAYNAVIISMFFEQYTFSTCMVGIAIYLQNVLHQSVLMASCVFLALNLLFGMVAPLGGKAVDRYGLRKIAAGSAFLLALACLLFNICPLPNSLYCLLGVLMLIGITMGFIFSALNAGILMVVDPQQVGISTSIFMLLALLGNIFSVTITTAVFITTSQWRLGHLINLTLSSQQLTQLKAFILHLGDPRYTLDLFNAGTKMLIIQIMPRALAGGAYAAMSIAVLFMLLTALICWKYLPDKN